MVHSNGYALLVELVELCVYASIAVMLALELLWQPTTAHVVPELILKTI